MKTKVIAIDQSTSATKAMLFNESCELLHRVNISHHQFYPHTGWVEHDAVEIYQNTLKAISCVLQQDEDKEECTYSLALTNQRETVVVWDRHTGLPVYNAVVWQCMRGASICQNLKEEGYNIFVRTSQLQQCICKTFSTSYHNIIFLKLLFFLKFLELPN